jgi:hypothetical protein
MEPALSSSVCHIASLPDELLVAIASELRIERGFLNDPDAEFDRCYTNKIKIRSLYSLALTCRKLNATTTPQLYRCIIWSPRKKSATSFLRTLFNNAKLSRQVRYLELEGKYDFPPRLKENYPEMYSKFEELRRRAERLIWSSPKSTGAILPIGTTKEPALFAAIKDCNFAVLTSMMDNLQEVAVPMIQDVLLWLVFRPTNGHDTLNRVWLRGAGVGGGETPGRPLKCKGVGGGDLRYGGPNLLLSTTHTRHTTSPKGFFTTRVAPSRPFGGGATIGTGGRIELEPFKRQP